MPADEVGHRRHNGSRDPSGRGSTSGAPPGPDARACRADPAEPAARGRGFRFRRSHRLLDRRDFDRVIGRGRRRSSPELVVVTSPPGSRGRLPDPEESEGVLRGRLGITVGRKAGSSVERNRFKRLVREWFRHQRASLPEPLDIVVIARRSGVELSLEDLSQRLARLLDSSRSQVSGKAKETEKS